MNEKIDVVDRSNDNNSCIVSFNGVCPLCGSSDGMIIRGNDGRYRNICRVFRCKAWYIPAPATGFEKESDCRRPFASEYLTSETVTVREYLFGHK